MRVEGARVRMSEFCPHSNDSAIELDVMIICFLLPSTTSLERQILEIIS